MKVRKVGIIVLLAHHPDKPRILCFLQGSKWSRALKEGGRLPTAFSYCHPRDHSLVLHHIPLIMAKYGLLVYLDYPLNIGTPEKRRKLLVGYFDG